MKIKSLLIAFLVSVPVMLQAGTFRTDDLVTTRASVLSMTGAGFVKNTATGSLNGGQIITEPDVPDAITRDTELETRLSERLSVTTPTAQTVNSNLTLANTTHESISVMATGSTVITNGTMDTSSNWTFGTDGHNWGWTHSGGRANVALSDDGDPADLSQTGAQLEGAIVEGTMYIVEFNYQLPHGRLTPMLNGTAAAAVDYVDADDLTIYHYSQSIVAGASGGFVLRATIGTDDHATAYVDDVTVVPITGNSTINGSGLVTTHGTFSGGVSVGTSGAAAGQVLAQKVTAGGTVRGNAIAVTADGTIGLPNAGLSMVLKDAATDALALLNGYLGIGTTTPETQIHIQKSNASAFIQLESADDADVSTGVFDFVKNAQDSTATLVATGPGEQLGGIRWRGVSAGAVRVTGAVLKAEQTGAAGGGSVPSRFVASLYDSSGNLKNPLIVSPTQCTMDNSLNIGSGTSHSYSLSSGLVRHFKLNDNAADTDVEDAAPDYGSNATASVNTDQLAMTGKGGALATCFDMNGSTEYVTADDSDELDPANALTVAFWMNSDAVTGSGSNGLLTKWQSQSPASANSWRFTYSTNSIAAQIFTGTWSSAVLYSFSTVISNGTWYHIVIVYDTTQPAGSRFRLYKNGVRQTATVTTEGNQAIPNSTAPVRIGADANAGSASRFFDGKLDDVRIYGRALNAAEVFELYNRGSGLETYPSGSIALDVNGKGYFDDTVYAKEFLTWSDPASKVILERKVPDLTASSLGAATISYKFNPSIIGYTTKTVETPTTDGKGTTTALEYTPVYDDADKLPENFGFDALQLPEPLRRYVDGKWMINWPGVVALQADHNAKQQTLIEELQHRVDVLETANISILSRISALEKPIGVVK